MSIVIIIHDEYFQNSMVKNQLTAVNHPKKSLLYDCNNYLFHGVRLSVRVVELRAETPLNLLGPAQLPPRRL